MAPYLLAIVWCDPNAHTCGFSKSIPNTLIVYFIFCFQNKTTHPSQSDALWTLPLQTFRIQAFVRSLKMHKPIFYCEKSKVHGIFTILVKVAEKLRIENQEPTSNSSYSLPLFLFSEALRFRPTRFLFAQPLRRHLQQCAGQGGMQKYRFWCKTAPHLSAISLTV